MARDHMLLWRALIAVDSAEEKLSRDHSDGFRILGYDCHRRIQEISEREVAEAYDCDLPVQPGQAQRADHADRGQALLSEQRRWRILPGKYLGYRGLGGGNRMEVAALETRINAKTGLPHGVKVSAVPVL